MELLNSLRRGNLLFQNRIIYSFYHFKSHRKVKDKEHLNLRCLVQVGPDLWVIKLTNQVSPSGRLWVPHYICLREANIFIFYTCNCITVYLIILKAKKTGKQ